MFTALALGMAVAFATPADSGPSAPGAPARLATSDCPDGVCLDPAPALSSAAARPCPRCGQDESLWRASTDKAPPALLGKTGALTEAACGKLIYGTSASERLAPASLTKIATALVVMEAGRPQEMVSIAVTGWELAINDDSTIMGLEAGMRLSVEELLQGLLMMSGNDAAIALADHFGGQDRFVRRMNDLVARLGLTDTQFRNVHGLDADGHYASAFDLTVLGRTLLADPLLAQIVSTDHFDTTWSAAGIWNGNWLLYIYPGAIGVKTGYTEAAGSTIVAAAARDGRTLIASVLNSPDVFLDSIRLFNWAFANVPRVC